MKINKYRLLQDRFNYKAGTIVYDCVKPNYGCVSDDDYFTGMEHISVTEDETGDYPFFTVAVEHLEKLDD